MRWRGGSSSEGLVCSPCCHLGHHPFARPSREPPCPTQTSGFRRTAGHENGLRRSRTHCHFTCLACRPPRAEQSCPCAHPRPPFLLFKTVLLLKGGIEDKNGQQVRVGSKSRVRVAAACTPARASASRTAYGRGIRGPKAERAWRRVAKVGYRRSGRIENRSTQTTFRPTRRLALSKRRNAAMQAGSGSWSREAQRRLSTRMVKPRMRAYT